jgi:hypothetical protein
LAVDKVIVLFKRKVVFKQYIPKKQKRFRIKIDKLCDMTGYTYDMEVYLGKDRLLATTDMTATHATVKQLTRKIQSCDHKLYMDNYFSSPDLYRDLIKQKLNCCDTVRPNRKGIPDDFRSKTLKLKWGDVRVRTNGDMTALVWKDKRDVYILTNIHDPPAEGIFCDESGNALKPAIVANYNRHMSIKGTELPTASLSVAVHGIGQRNCFSISST